MKIGKYQIRIQSTDCEELHVTIESDEEYFCGWWNPESQTFRKWGDSEHRTVSRVTSQPEILAIAKDRKWID